MAFSEGGDETQSEDIQINALIKRVVRVTSMKLKENNVSLNYLISDEELSIKCRPGLIEQVIVNLINNSTDALDETDIDSRVIEIKVEQDPEKQGIKIIISDNGPGIPEEIADKIMDPFYSTKPIGQGTGLGLAISHGIVRSHGGNLYLDRETTGATFILELPKTDQVIPEKLLTKTNSAI